MSARDWKAAFGVRFAMAVATTISLGHEIGLEDVDIMGGINRSNVAQARQDVISYVQQTRKHTHIMLFDDDMVFPPDVVIKLAKHKKKFIFPNVAQKDPTKVKGVCLDGAGERIDSTGRSGLEQVSWGTLACTLIDVNCFIDVHPPHFAIEWNADRGFYIAEDHYFMKLMKKYTELWCDHDLSQDVKHIGDYPFGFELNKGAT